MQLSAKALNSIPSFKKITDKTTQYEVQWKLDSELE